MKFFLSVLLIMLFSFCACLFFPWWSIAVVAFLVLLFLPQRPFPSFLAGFIALFLLWGSLSLWISVKNGHILAHRVSILIFKTDSPLLLITATALIGAIVAGFAALTASFAQFWKPETRKAV